MKNKLFGKGNESASRRINHLEQVIEDADANEDEPHALRKRNVALEEQVNSSY